MPYDTFKHHRHSIRLRGYDYTQAGAYFVTIVAHNRECLLGDVVDGEMHVNETGQIVVECWNALPAHFPNVELDAFVVMPNHIHAIIVLKGKGEAFANSANASPLQPHGTAPGSIGAIIQNFKSVSTRKINQHRDPAGTPIWHRNYGACPERSEGSTSSATKNR
jgi:hypothetical protein